MADFLPPPIEKPDKPHFAPEWTTTKDGHRSESDYHYLGIWKCPYNKGWFQWYVQKKVDGENFRATGIEHGLKRAKKMANWVVERRESERSW